MEFTFVIPGRLPSYNEFYKQTRQNFYQANKTKQDTELFIMSCIPRTAPKFTKPVEIYIEWVVADQRRDTDNIASAKKFILDALQKRKVIQNDSYKLCKVFDVGFPLNRSEPKVIVKITDEYPKGYRRKVW